MIQSALNDCVQYWGPSLQDVSLQGIFHIQTTASLDMKGIMEKETVLNFIIALYIDKTSNKFDTHVYICDKRTH
jgi:hypothetical protein